MKYIDADLLKKEIEKKFWDYGTPLHDDEVTTKVDEILSFIDSLQQEQPEVDLNADIEMEWDSFNKHLAEYDKESEEVVWLNWISFVDLACYFYNIGRNARKED